MPNRETAGGIENQTKGTVAVTVVSSRVVVSVVQACQAMVDLLYGLSICRSCQVFFPLRVVVFSLNDYFLLGH